MSLHPKRLSLADHERTPFTPPYIITLLKLSKVLLPVLQIHLLPYSKLQRAVFLSALPCTVAVRSLGYPLLGQPFYLQQDLKTISVPLL